MPIIKTLTLDNGLPVEYHVVRRVQWTTRRGVEQCAVMLDSWLNEASFQTGGNPAHSQVVELGMSGSLTPTLAAEAELVSAGGYLDGGLVVVAAASGDLASAKLRAKARVNVERDRRIALPKVVPVGRFDAAPLDLATLSRVANATRLKVAAGRTGAAAKSRITLSDDTRPRLSLAELEAAQLEIADQIEALFDTAHDLRRAINACATLAAVDAVAWP